MCTVQTYSNKCRQPPQALMSRRPSPPPPAIAPQRGCGSLAAEAAGAKHQQSVTTRESDARAKSGGNDPPHEAPEPWPSAAEQSAWASAAASAPGPADEAMWNDPEAGDNKLMHATRVTKTLWPPAAGTAQISGRYAQDLVCVRYRQDANGLRWGPATAMRAVSRSVVRWAMRAFTAAMAAIQTGQSNRPMLRLLQVKLAQLSVRRMACRRASLVRLVVHHRMAVGLLRRHAPPQHAHRPAAAAAPHRPGPRGHRLTQRP